MTPNAVGGLLGRMASLDATRSERRLVEYLLSLPDAERAIVSNAEVCKRTGTSRATVDRLSRRLGYPGFVALRRSLVREGAEALGGYTAESPLDPAIAVGDDPATVATKVLASVSSRAMAFAQMLSADERLQRVVSFIDRADRIALVGAGLSSMVAMDMHHRLLRLGLNVVYSEDDHTQLALASLTKAGDVIILVSYSGRTLSVIQALTVARDRGAHTVALTGDPASTLARLAEVCITTPPGVGLFGNDAALTRLLQMVFSDVLFHCLALADPRRLERVSTIDEILGALKVAPRQGRSGGRSDA